MKLNWPSDGLQNHRLQVRSLSHLPMFTYINYLRLEGEELNADFEKQCRANGFVEGMEIFVVPVRSVTGHATFIVTFSESNDERE